MHKYTIATMLVVVSVITGPLMASALTAQVGVNTAVEAHMGSTSANAESNASASTNTTGTKNKAGLDAGVKVGATITKEADESSSANSTKEESEESVDSETVESSASVKNETDLNAYLRSVLKSDTHVRAAEADTSSVSVTYDSHAYLFGIIPITVPVTATVHTHGETTVQYPWFAVFTSHDSAALEGKVKMVGSGLSANTSANATLSASTKAEVINELRAALAAQFSASVKAQN